MWPDSKWLVRRIQHLLRPWWVFGYHSCIIILCGTLNIFCVFWILLSSQCVYSCRLSVFSGAWLEPTFGFALTWTPTLVMWVARFLVWCSLLLARCIRLSFNWTLLKNGNRWLGTYKTYINCTYFVNFIGCNYVGGNKSLKWLNLARWFWPIRQYWRCQSLECTLGPSVLGSKRGEFICQAPRCIVYVGQAVAGCTIVACRHFGRKKLIQTQSLPGKSSSNFEQSIMR